MSVCRMIQLQTSDDTLAVSTPAIELVRTSPYVSSWPPLLTIIFTIDIWGQNRYSVHCAHTSEMWINTFALIKRQILGWSNMVKGINYTETGSGRFL
jgi:hypothetical protein